MAKYNTFAWIFNYVVISKLCLVMYMIVLHVIAYDQAVLHFLYT